MHRNVVIEITGHDSSTKFISTNTDTGQTSDRSFSWMNDISEEFEILKPTDEVRKLILETVDAFLNGKKIGPFKKYHPEDCFNYLHGRLIAAWVGEDGFVHDTEAIGIEKSCFSGPEYAKHLDSFKVPKRFKVKSVTNGEV